MKPIDLIDWGTALRKIRSGYLISDELSGNLDTDFTLEAGILLSFSYRAATRKAHMKFNKLVKGGKISNFQLSFIPFSPLSSSKEIWYPQWVSSFILCSIPRAVSMKVSRLSAIWELNAENKSFQTQLRHKRVGSLRNMRRGKDSQRN